MNLDKIAEKYGIGLAGEYAVAVDYENNAEEWWNGGGRELWRRLVSPDFFMDETFVSGEELAIFLADAEKIPGWDDSPDHAKYPFYVVDAEDPFC